ERLGHDLLVNLVREVRVKGPAVDLPLAGARHDAHPGDGFLAAAGAVGVAGDNRTARGARRGRLGGLGRVLRGASLGVKRLFGGVLLGEVCRVVCGRLYACGLGHVALPHASLRHYYWEICRISYGCGCWAWCGCVGPA